MKREAPAENRSDSDGYRAMRRTIRGAVIEVESSDDEDPASDVELEPESDLESESESYESDSDESASSDEDSLLVAASA